MFAIQELKSGLYVSETHLENPSKGHFFKWCETDKYRRKLFDTVQSANDMVSALSMDKKSGNVYRVVEMQLEEICVYKISEIAKSVRNPFAKYAIRNPITKQYIDGKLNEGDLKNAKLFAMTGTALDFLRKQTKDFSKYSNYEIVRFAVKRK